MKSIVHPCPDPCRSNVFGKVDMLATEFNLSRLMLGTVQFGMPYGIANRTGQPAYETVRAIMAAALEGGVNCFDTAAAYGNSEEVLGRVLQDLKAADDVVVITKTKPLTMEESADPVLAARAIEQSIETSRRRLRLDCLPIVLFHRETDARYLNVLARLKTKGWLRYAGVSCDNRPGPVATFVASGHAAALQLPANILDRRHRQSGVFQKAADAGVAVFIRSVYLQGLLVMPPAEIPPALQAMAPVCRRLGAIAQQAGMTSPELAIRYMLAQDGVTSILTGVETVRQIRDNLHYFSRGPLDRDVVAAVDQAVPDLPETVLTPALWPTMSTERKESEK